jgi:hypothetical protein
MKTLFTSLFLMIGIVLTIQAQDKTTIEAANSDISDNLDLEAVATLFADAESIEDFETKLNDPESRYSNLDLNEDGYVDYLRVLEKKKGNAHSITIQAVVGKDLYQDVATIDVEKDEQGKTRVQVVGDVYMYGPNYIIEPVYVHTPVIFTWFWGPRWTVWYSPWYYGYYPRHWSYWNPYPYNVYYGHVRSHVHVHHTFHYVPYRRSTTCRSLSKEVYRGDLAKDKPAMAFNARQKDVKNKYELDNKRGTQSLAKPMPADNTKTTGKEIRSDWKPQSEKEGRPSNVKDNKVEISKDERPVKTDSQKPRTDEAKPRATEQSTKGDSRDEAKPNVEKPRSEAKPRTEPQPRVETKPRSEAKPRIETESRNEAKPRTTPKPRKEAKPRKETKPRSEAKPRTPAKPSSTKPSSPPKPKAPSSTRPSSSSKQSTPQNSKSTGNSSRSGRGGR